MQIELDDFPLIKRIENPQTNEIEEIRSISNINISCKREIAEHRLPTSDGSILLDLGRNLVRIYFDGVIKGKDAKSSLESLREKFKNGTPLSFSSDLSSIPDIEQVILEEIHIKDIGGVPYQYEYSLGLLEYRPPPPRTLPPPSQDEEAQQEVENQSHVNDIIGKIVDMEGNSKSNVTVIITGPDGEYRVQTNDEGEYRLEDLPPGNYIIKVDLPEYKGFEKEVEIESDESSSSR